MTILITAYDIDPYKGSESGTGWNFVYYISKVYKVIVITRKNNRNNIEKYIKEFNIDCKNLRFLYFDLPYYLRFWKKGRRGSSLYFYLWQMFVPLFIKRKKISFDIAHGLNFHADSFPTFLWMLRKPTVWGPINHNEKIPKIFFLSKKDFIIDRIKWNIKLFLWKFDPFIYLAKKRVKVIIGGTYLVKKRLKIPEKKFILMTQVGANEINLDKKLKKENKNEFIFLSVGRFINIKSFDVSLRAFEKFCTNLNDDEKKRVRMILIGKGPLKEELVKIKNKLKCKDYIFFYDWVKKEELAEFYNKSNVFVFPSHEGAGMVLCEAMSYGIPIICFDNYGPGEIVKNAGLLVPYCDSYSSVIEVFSMNMLMLFKNEEIYKLKSYLARKRFCNECEWKIKIKKIINIYENLIKE